MKKRSMGSDFDDFLKEKGMLEEATAVAVKRVIAWRIEQEMAAQKRLPPIQRERTFRR